MASWRRRWRRWRPAARSSCPENSVRSRSGASRGTTARRGIRRCRRCISCCWLERKRDRADRPARRDRKSTRLNSSHTVISYAVFCLKKKKKKRQVVRDHGFAESLETRIEEYIIVVGQDPL